MIILSYNCRGLASQPKKLALKELVRSNKPDIIFLQETLGKGEEVTGCLNKILPDWSFHVLDSNGHSGGVALGFNSKVLREISSWGWENVLAVELFSSELCIPFLIINVYGPVVDREKFWSPFFAKSFMTHPNLVIGGDLNFSLGTTESWGVRARPDPLTDFFITKLASSPLVDVTPLKMRPSWRNRRIGDDWVEKKIDRFLICDSLSENLQAFRHWVGEGGLSDHFPVFLEVKGAFPKPGTPFKFNTSWLLDASYINLFHSTWINDNLSEDESRGKAFMENLTRMKAEIALLEDSGGIGYRTDESWARLKDLELERKRILQNREESWRLKSRAIWLQAGDDNTKFFQNYAKGRKNSNTIWEMEKANGDKARSFEELASLGNSYFKNLFKQPEEATIAEVIRATQFFPRFIEEEGNDSIMAPVSKEEVEDILKSMQKDKSPGPDGWTVEFFHHFFEYIGDELVAVVEESRRTGSIFQPFNSTFLALIPKSDLPGSFADFRPISLCTCVYKIIAKVIASRLKPFLSRNISPEQFGFLDGRQIHEAVGVAQETLHSLKIRKKKGVVVKIDLSKAFDRINCLFLRLLLTHLGFRYDFVKWIMSCVSSSSIAVLINGAASNFFNPERGLRQGCPLSPLLFLLAAKGISLMIHDAKRQGTLKGIEVAENLWVTHLLFVDDIIMFSNGSLEDCKTIKRILDLFLKAIGLCINERKSSLTSSGLSEDMVHSVKMVLNFDVKTLEDTFKYLGFLLKPDNYRIKDWTWILAKIESKLKHWSFRWLSRAGRLVLIKSVLMAVPVFWASLTWVPKGVLSQIDKVCSRFLWAGSKSEKVTPWIAWDKVARPKEWGGWGIKNLQCFSQSLAAKLAWRLISFDNLWTTVTKRKYIDPLSTTD
eukprot:PITA_19452